jgi:transposase InsO family protein
VFELAIPLTGGLREICGYPGARCRGIRLRQRVLDKACASAVAGSSGMDVSDFSPPGALWAMATPIAQVPRQVWCWDMTYPLSQVDRRWCYLYLIPDLYSRKIMDWEVHEDEDSTLKATRVLSMLNWPCAKLSYSQRRARCHRPWLPFCITIPPLAA